MDTKRFGVRLVYEHFASSDKSGHRKNRVTASCNQTMKAEDLASGSDERLYFSESTAVYRLAPEWVKSFIDIGYRWRISSEQRQLLFLTTPCESPAAGLIALGSLRRRMEDPNGSDEQGHFERISRVAAQRGNNSVIRNINRRGYYRVTRRDERGLWVASGEGTGAERLLLMPENASDWFIDGQPRVSSLKGHGLAFENLYNHLTEGKPILRRNLQLSDSVICLAGLPSGESATRDSYSDTQLRVGSETATLSELLSVHGWHPEVISRLRYFNPRTKCFDRDGPVPELVVADGVRAFSAIQSREDCASASIITVVPRTADPEQLEEVRHSIGSLAQWYTPADASAVVAPAAGVSALLLVQKE